MAEPLSPAAATSPAPGVPQKRVFDDDHLPSVPSPLNPDASTTRSRAPPKPSMRETREKRETAKKRDSTAARGSTPDSGSKKKSVAKAFETPSPLRYAIQPPRPEAYEPPKDPSWASHEPEPIYVPGTEQTVPIELRRRVEHIQNKKDYRYTVCVADPRFEHLKWYRQSEVSPYSPRMSFEDSDKWIMHDSTGCILTNQRGWRMLRANMVAREGSLYYEVKILRGVPSESLVAPSGQEGLPQPHIRMGWARREAPLDAPVGYDGYSYGIRDVHFETIHRSRPGKLLLHDAKRKPGRQRTSEAKPAPPVTEDDDSIREGDVIGLELNLPSLALHRKVVEGQYNPLVDVTNGFDDPPTTHDIVRDRIPIPFKGNFYFEENEYSASKAMDQYGERSPFNTIKPNSNHEQAPLRTLPGSSIKIYKNGAFKGVAFENLMAFLPPASSPEVKGLQGPRAGFDDGTLGYYPAVAAFSGGVAQVNFGPNFWYKPSHLQVRDRQQQRQDLEGWAGSDETRPMSERWTEQIAEDVLYDVIDEADFFVQDGGYGGRKSGAENAAAAAPVARGLGKQEDD